MYWEIVDETVDYINKVLVRPDPNLRPDPAIMLETVSRLAHHLGVVTIYNSWHCRERHLWGAVMRDGKQRPYIEIAAARPLVETSGDHAYLALPYRIPGNVIHELVHIFSDHGRLPTAQEELEAELTTYMYSLEHGMSYWKITITYLAHYFKDAAMFYRIAKEQEGQVRSMVSFLQEHENG